MLARKAELMFAWRGLPGNEMYGLAMYSAILLQYNNVSKLYVGFTWTLDKPAWISCPLLFLMLHGQQSCSFLLK